MDNWAGGSNDNSDLYSGSVRFHYGLELHSSSINFAVPSALTTTSFYIGFSFTYFYSEDGSKTCLRNIGVL
jgi:hypothetical protein